MSETRQIFIESVEEKNGFYVVHSGDVRYGTKEAGIKAFVNKTATFNVAEVQKGKFKNIYINAPLPEIPHESTPSKAVPKENTMLMAYAKDIVVALIQTAQLKDPAESAGQKTVDLYNKLLVEMNTPYESEIPF